MKDMGDINPFFNLHSDWLNATHNERKEYTTIDMTNKEKSSFCVTSFPFFGWFLLFMGFWMQRIKSINLIDKILFYSI